MQYAHQSLGTSNDLSHFYYTFISVLILSVLFIFFAFSALTLFGRQKGHLACKI